MLPVGSKGPVHSYQLRDRKREYPSDTLESLVPAEIADQLTDAAKTVSPRELHLYKQGETTISALGLTVDDLRSIQDVLDERTVWGGSCGNPSPILGPTGCCCCCCSGCCSCAAIQDEV